MILRKLIVENFRQLQGRAEIEFAPPGDRNVTVILGENGAGKTTLLNAFLWCLYEEVELEEPDKILSHKAAQETPIGKDVQVEVTLVFDVEDVPFRVSRRQIYRKKDGGDLDESGRDFRVDMIQKNGESRPADDPVQTVGQILPKDLSKFFFFRGEEVENLALQTSAETLKDGVETFLDLHLIGEAIKHSAQVRKDFEGQLSKIAVGDLKELQETIEREDADLEGAERRLQLEQEQTDELNKQRERVEKELSNVEETRPLIEAKKRIEQTLADLENRRAERKQLLSSAISRNGYLIPKTNVLSVAVSLADAAISRGELPAKIKPQFVDDLIAEGDCICGRPIDEHARECLLKWKGNRGLADLEESIGRVRSSIRFLLERKTESEGELAERRGALAALQQQIHDATAELSRTNTALKGQDFKIEYVSGLQANLKKLENDIVERRVAIGVLKEDIEKRQGRLAELREKRKQKDKSLEKVDVIERRITATERTAAVLAQMKSDWATIVQEYLDGVLKTSWKEIAQLDRLVQFDTGFHLTMKERGASTEWVVSAASSANLRALALCFVAALIRLAGEVGRDDTRAGKGLFRGGDYPLVMDAPFATMDAYFKKTVPRGLRTAVPQIVLLTNFDHWRGEVEASFGKAMGACYVLELHTPAVDETRTVKVGKSSVDYVVSERNADTDWSSIVESKQ